jgi:hypothetical protein
MACVGPYVLGEKMLPSAQEILWPGCTNEQPAVVGASWLDNSSYLCMHRDHFNDGVLDVLGFGTQLKCVTTVPHRLRNHSDRIDLIARSRMLCDIRRWCCGIFLVDSTKKQRMAATRGISTPFCRQS